MLILFSDFVNCDVLVLCFCDKFDLRFILI